MDNARRRLIITAAVYMKLLLLLLLAAVAMAPSHHRATNRRTDGRTDAASESRCRCFSTIDMLVYCASEPSDQQAKPTVCVFATL